MAKKNIKILVVDDTEVNIKVIEMFLEPRGYDVVRAEDGEIAIAQFSAEKPDIILMDVMMPNVDGYEATSAIRKLSGELWVPIIFLSAKTKPEDQVKGIEVGGDDYLTKPVNLSLLEAKLSALIRIVNIQKELEKAHEALKGYCDRSDRELEFAKKLMENMMLNTEESADGSLRIRNEPLEEISGDMITTVRTKNDELYVLVADATGHGLAASISQIPVQQTFKKMAEVGFTVSAIARTINEKLKRLLPPERFVTATIAVIKHESRLIELWNGSNPTAIFFDDKGRALKVFEKSSFALGVVDNNVFDSKTEVFLWPDKGELLIFSDGIVDVTNEKGESFGTEGVCNAMLALGDGSEKMGFDLAWDQAMAFSSEGKREDDISLISITCN